ncbi:MAG: ABC transporter permease [Bacteroidota bacterium]|nr:ABC transporter permease [Bacteroidota bacterium]MDP4204800.1 ABC transporter permease [Bacteroidota bacterium]
MKSFWDSPFSKVVKREFDRISGSWVFIFITMIAPLFSFLLIMSIFSGGVPRNLPITVVDDDNTELSQKIIRLVDATPIAAVAYRCPNVAEGKRLMEKGKTDAILYIQRDTEKEVYKARSPRIILYINNTNVVKGGLIYSGLYKVISTISAGIKLNVAMKSGAILTEQAMGQIMPVRVNSHILFNPFGSYSYFLTTSLLPVMVIVFTLLGSIYAFGSELKNGTGPEWLDTAGNSITVAIAGKMLPYTILFMMQILVMDHILFRYLGTPIRGSFSIILLTGFLMVLAYQCMAILLIALSANLRLSLSLGSAYTMMALTFSGLTFPLIGMPVVAKVFAHLFPFTYWLKVFVGQSLRGEPVVEAIAPMYTFIVFILVSLMFVPRLKRILTDERYWGRV